MDKPTIKQLNYLARIRSQLDGWDKPEPITKEEASAQIDEAKAQWSTDRSGDLADIY